MSPTVDASGPLRRLRRRRGPRDPAREQAWRMPTAEAVAAEDTLIHVLVDQRRAQLRRGLGRADRGHPAEHRGDRPRRAAGAAEDRGALAADRLRVRPDRRRRRLPRVVLQGRPGRARAVRAGRRGLDPERAAARRGLLVRVRQRPRDRPADDHQRVARPADPQGHRRRRGRHLRDVRRHPRHGRQPDRRDGRARTTWAGSGSPRPASRSSACPAARSSPTTCPRR